MKEDGRQYWDSKALSWKDGALEDASSDVKRFIEDHLSAYIPDGNGLILNVGSGSAGGRYLSRCRETSIFSLDYAEKMLKVGQYKGRAIEADAGYDLPLASETIDLVCSFFLMRYLSFDEQVRLIGEMSRVLKNGGRMVVIDIPDNEHKLMVEKFSPEKLAPYLSSMGMDLVEAVIEKRELKVWISTGFGGSEHNRGSYNIGVLVATKR